MSLDEYDGMYISKLHVAEFGSAPSPPPCIP